MSGAAVLRRLRGLRARLGPVDPGLARLSEEERQYLSSLHDDSVPLPPGAERELSPSNGRLRALRADYARLDHPASTRSRWTDDAVEGFLDLRWFRGETLYMWHYREGPRVTALKYFILARYIADRDRHGWLRALSEDGAFGCWTFDYPGLGRVSRDLLDSVNELCFLERQLQLSSRERLAVLDVGAGYGRLAHRMAQALPGLADYCCVDAIPESTFLSEYYLRHRGVYPPVRVVALGEVEDGLAPGSFSLAVNVHAFSECSHAAIAWWMDQVQRLRIPRLLIVPNEPTELLSLEPDGSRRPYGPLVEAAGLPAGAPRARHRRPSGTRAGAAQRPLPPVRPPAGRAMSELHLACAADDAYLPHCAAMLHSALGHAPNGGVQVHFLHGATPRRRDRDRLRAMVEALGAAVSFVRVRRRTVAKLPLFDYPPAVWYRVLLPELLPVVDRVLYLDADTLVVDKLAPLWETDLAGDYLGAVTNVLMREHDRPAALGLPDERYFNSGVLLMDLAALRRAGCVAAMLDYARRGGERLAWPDQDTLSAVLGESRRALHPRWNCMLSVRNFPWAEEVLGTRAVEEARRAPGILHFEGPEVNKPWHPDAPAADRERYLAHRQATPWPELGAASRRARVLRP